MELSRSILVHELQQSTILCYNSTFPHLISLCEEGTKCSTRGPTYGCSSRAAEFGVCSEVHLCNAPVSFAVSLVAVAFAIIFLLTSGCLWCCFCCCCGSCCKSVCPCFARRSTEPRPSQVQPAWTSYEGDASDGPTSAATTARNPVVVQYSQEVRASAPPPPPPPTQDSRFYTMAPKYHEPGHY